MEEEGRQGRRERKKGRRKTCLCQYPRAEHRSFSQRATDWGHQSLGRSLSLSLSVYLCVCVCVCVGSEFSLAWCVASLWVQSSPSFTCTLPQLFLEDGVTPCVQRIVCVWVCVFFVHVRMRVLPFLDI